MKSLSLFWFGLFVHLVYAVIVLTTDNLFSEAFYSDPSRVVERIADFHIDSRAYAGCADNYIKYGVFGKGEIPEFNRTLGLPMIIYFFKLLVGNYWYYAFVLFQIVAGAAVYPLTYRIGTAFFPSGERAVYWASAVLILLGGYFTKCLYVMADLNFAIFFLSGICLSLLSVVKRENNALIFLAVLLLTFASLIRPNALLYVIAHFLMLYCVARIWDTWRFRRTRALVWISAIVLLFSGNTSSFRMYYYYGTFTPTDILGRNMFKYSTKEILSKLGKEDEYIHMRNEMYRNRDWRVLDRLRKQAFFETVKKYPATAVEYWIESAVSNFISPHYMEIGRVYGYYKRDSAQNRIKLRRSEIMAFIFYVFLMVNLLLIALFLYFLLCCLVQREYLLFLSISSVVAVIVLPSFLSASGPRFKIPVEPFVFFCAFVEWGRWVGRHRS